LQRFYKEDSENELGRHIAHGLAGIAKKHACHHELTEARQGKYHYTMGPYSDPVLSIAPGDRVVVQTRDAFEGKITSEQDDLGAKLNVPFLNPQNGPIWSKGAEGRRDRRVHRIDGAAWREPRGTCCMIPNFGALTAPTTPRR